jgi:protein-disulfide isomerase/uncharacterized membrane protein
MGHLLNLPMPCGASSGCAAVAAHPSSMLFGIPIAFFGVAFYLTLLFLTARPVVERRGRLAVAGLTGLGTLISAGLLHHSHANIGAICTWCAASGAITALLFLLSLVALRTGRLGGCRPAFTWALIFLLAMGLGVQVGAMQRASLDPSIDTAALAAVAPAELAAGLKSLGEAEAPLTIVEFGDLACPGCGAVHGSLTSYQAANPRGVRLVFRHQPLALLKGHHLSGAAAAVGEIAAEQGAYWKFAHRIYGANQPLSGKLLLETAESLGLDPAEVERRIADPNDPALLRLQQDIDLAEALGVEATPTFVLILQGHPPRATTTRGLERFLNSPPVLAAVAAARE